jgi:hypothetical protein
MRRGTDGARFQFIGNSTASMMEEIARVLHIARSFSSKFRKAAAAGAYEQKRPIAIHPAANLPLLSVNYMCRE